MDFYTLPSDDASMSADTQEAFTGIVVQREPTVVIDDGDEQLHLQPLAGSPMVKLGQEVVARERNTEGWETAEDVYEEVRRETAPEQDDASSPDGQ